MKNILDEVREKYNLSFIEKLNNETDIGVYIFGGALRDIYLNKEWKEVDLRITLNKSREEREFKIETLLEEYNLGGKTQIENLNLTVYRFLPVGSNTKEFIDLSLVPTLQDNLPDFTINSIFYDLKKEEVLDIYNGILDLKNKVIKTVKNPTEQFKEEPHMMFRAVKFACQLDFKIEEETLDAIVKNSKGVQNTLDFIKNQKEGIFVELFLGNIFKGLKSSPIQYFEYLNKTNLYRELLKFCSRELNLNVVDNKNIEAKDKGTYEGNISYLFSSIINALGSQNKQEDFNKITYMLAISTPKLYSDFVVDIKEIRFG